MDSRQKVFFAEEENVDVPESINDLAKTIATE